MESAAAELNLSFISSKLSQIERQTTRAQSDTPLESRLWEEGRESVSLGNGLQRQWGVFCSKETEAGKGLAAARQAVCPGPGSQVVGRLALQVPVGQGRATGPPGPTPGLVLPEPPLAPVCRGWELSPDPCLPPQEERDQEVQGTRPEAVFLG